MSKRPSNILGVKKGTIDIGYDGDLVIIDLDYEYEINSQNFISKGKNTPFNGEVVFGKILTTIKGGKVVFENN